MKAMFSKTMLVALAVAITAVVGAASVSYAANGKPFILGKNNAATAVSTLVKQGPGPAFKLLVRPGQPPMAVNSNVKVANFNADSVDGKSAQEIGVNGIERVTAVSSFDSESSKTATVRCPAGKVVVGTGAALNGGFNGTPPNADTDVAIRNINPSNADVGVSAMEETPTGANWNVVAVAMCATAP